MALTEAQKRAKEKYNEKNREKTRYYSYKATAKSFIRNNATLEDLKELEILIKEIKEEKFEN
ncbi:hypothetical protein [Fusobacterium perfoetens]|uniref:hypothetical protein n=1 Tax=Fusobacterium perfoetens TaxID=852 RepID=UPI001F2D3561|nr:hypothetical protein [Fusobacterium perfoetens]MCF2611770.1 hypothetical protein [Fusobacterium perfoetens]